MKTQIEKLDRLIREIEMDEYLNEETLPKIREAKGLLNTLHEQCNIANVVKSLPNDEEVKAHIDTLPYYGTCTTEYNEGFEDGVKWLKEQLAK